MKRAVRHLVLVLGDQLCATSSAFDGFDPAQRCGVDGGGLGGIDARLVAANAHRAFSVGHAALSR